MENLIKELEKIQKTACSSIECDMCDFNGTENGVFYCNIDEVIDGINKMKSILENKKMEVSK